MQENLPAETLSAIQAAAPKVHNGTYTVSHPERGHFTIRIRTRQKGDLAGKRVIELLVGPDNTSSYQGVAFWNDAEEHAIVWRRFRGATDQDGRIDAYRWRPKGWSTTQQKLAIWCDLALRGPERGFWSGEGYTLQCSSVCVRCNRKLTHPESIKAGIGPECAGRS